MMKSITLPVRTRWLGISIENHPVCSHCAGLLDRAETVGMIGYILPDHSVITVQGEHIGAKGNLGDEKEGEDRAVTIPIHLISPWMTNDAILSIVHLMKYKSYDALASLMSSSIVTAFHTFSWPIPENSVLIPVPMHEKDRRERNRNHSEAICRRISIKLGLPVARTALKKVRRTRRQSQTARNARAKNVEGAFSANNVAGHHVFLVDDVVTSGTTSAACITALMSAGARSVSVLSFARSL
jgi:ComF family protein